MKYAIEVKCPVKRSKQVKKSLKRYGLKWLGGENYAGMLTRKTYESLAVFCQHSKLKYRINNAYGSRSADYRRRFFRANPPPIGKMYFCAYCGRLRNRRHITVDHLYPVSRASKSIPLQKKLRRMGIRNINSPQNLVAACKRCNNRKGGKMGLWILRGKIGRYPELWIFRHTIRIIILSILLYWVLREHPEIVTMIMDILF